ncbi:MAG: MSCRAMM family protein [Micromonosporaceae bacterium]
MPALGSSFQPIGQHRASGAQRPDAGYIHGHVRKNGGGPVEGASLTLIDLAGGQIGRGATGADGAYRLSTPSPGSYFLIARARSHQPQASAVTVASEPVTLNISLTGMAELYGVVRVAGGQEPVPDALLTLLDLRGEVLGSTTTDPDGRFRFPELVGGSYTLAASASPFRPTARPVVVPETGSASHDLELIAGAYLRGSARGGAERRLLPDARITLLDAEGNIVASTTTDTAGEYVFSDVPEGSYMVHATGYPPVTANLQVFSGQKHEHDVELRHPSD